MAKVRQSESTWLESRDKWAKVWFEKLCRFHKRKPQPTWEFTADDAISFLRDHMRRKTPAWKRLKIIESLMCYRRYVQATGCGDLKPIQTKLEEIARAEKVKALQGTATEEILDEVGHINPNEPDIIQNLRRTIRGRQDALETERAYVADVRAFMRDRGLTCQADFESIKADDVEAHLTDLAVDGNVAAATQDRAFYAILYLFEHVLKREMGEVNAIRSSKGKQIPTVLSTEEIEKIYSHLRGQHLLIAQLLYGCGMRISEALRLRMKDFDFDRMLIEIHASKGGKSRFVPMPEIAVPEIRRWMESRRVLHEHDLDQGQASVCLPKALERKYPNAARELKWQFLFASHRLSRDPRTRAIRRHHLHKDTFPAQLRAAMQKAGILKHASSHTFRHSFATHLLRAGTDICTIQELLGHADIKTTRIYLHSLNREDVKVVSPLDRLAAKKVQPAPIAVVEPTASVEKTESPAPPRSSRRTRKHHQLTPTRNRVRAANVQRPRGSRLLPTSGSEESTHDIPNALAEASRIDPLLTQRVGITQAAARIPASSGPASSSPASSVTRWWKRAASLSLLDLFVWVGCFASTIRLGSTSHNAP